jgi:hypothetical protein
MKKCCQCGMTKMLSEYHKDKDTYRTQCKECRKTPNSKDVEICGLKKALAESDALVDALIKNCKIREQCIRKSGE